MVHRRIGCPIALLLTHLAALPLIAAPKQHVVTTVDGRRIIGRLTQSGALTLVKRPDKYVYLSPASVAKTEPAPDTEPWPVYEFHADKIAGPKTGKIANVLDSVQWGRLADGRMPVTVSDPKLGKVSFTLWVTRVDPFVLRLSGDAYEWSLGWPTPQWLGSVLPLIRSQIDATDAASLTQAIRFFRMAGDWPNAEALLAPLEAVADAGNVQTERLDIEAAQVRTRLRDVRLLIATGRRLRAQVELARLKLSDALRKAEPALGRELAAAAAEVRQPRATSTRPVGPLAKDVAAFFAAKTVDGAEALAAKLAASSLPQTAKLSLFTHATQYKAPAAPVRWTRHEFTPPGGRMPLHYYVRLPSDYTPDRAFPVLVALHGMHSTADAMRGFWSGHAERYRFILISPEYIYGRKWGYKFSSQEHRAVLASLWHAAGEYNLDMNRIFLTGHSQGGHAAFDIGPAHAGWFAGVIPIIGAPIVAHWQAESLANFKDVPLYAVNGELDASSPMHCRKAMYRLAAMKCDATYVEYISRGHEGFTEEFDAVCDWMLKRRRDPSPKEVNLVALRTIERRRNWHRIGQGDG